VAKNIYRVGEASASHQEEEIGEGEEDVYISGNRACTEAAKDKEQMCIEQSVRAMHV